MFRRDRHWVGGDGAYSIDLEDGRVLWLFGDSGIDPSGRDSRKSDGATMVSNTLGIQHGYDPSTATLTYYWQRNDHGRPAPYFPDGVSDRIWPGHGVKIRDRLIIFLMRVRNVNEGLGFDVHDWSSVIVLNPQDSPDAWRLFWLDRPSNDMQVIVGSGGVLAEGDYVYAFSTKEPGGHESYLVRWPAQDLYRGELSRMQWWSGAAGWTRESANGHDPTPVLYGAGTEFTVHRDSQTGHYLQVQSVGFGPAKVALRHASHLTGPWSEPTTIYTPPEYDKPDIMIYQGKAHPYLLGADIVLSYCTNSADFDNLINDDSIYYPRFVRLNMDNLP